MNIAVLVPVYNAEPYLAECLESLRAAGECFLSSARAAGEAARFEIRCLDDGSTDGSRRILDSFAARFSGGGELAMTVAAQPNRGVSKTRNALLDAVPEACDAVAFCDADDLVAPEMYATLSVALEKTGADVAESEWDGEAEDRAGVARLEDGNLLVTDMSAYLLRSTAPGRWINVINKLYRRTAVGETRFRDGLHFEEDLFFNYEINARLRRKVLVPRSFYTYRDNPSSATHALDLRAYFDSTTRRVRLSLSEFLAAGRIPPSLQPAWKAELAKDAYRMVLRKNLKKNGNAASRKELFLSAADFFEGVEREFSFAPVGLNPVQLALYRACRARRYLLASALVWLT